MTDARARFFDNMERDLAEASASKAKSERTDSVDFDFSVTESGRTVAHMVTASQRTSDSVDFSMEEFDRDVFNKALEGDVAQSGAAATGKKPFSATARSIPVPKAQPASHFLPQSQASSLGSSGSAFLSSVLNPTATTFNSTQLSHTPPTALGTSYEASHFGKRARSGSVSGRLRSASEYLEGKGLLDRETKGILKDLIIIGDEELQRAIDRYEEGDPSQLEEMIKSGALQNRLPPDLDLLEDLDLDFLSVNGHTVDQSSNIDPLRHPGASGEPPWGLRSQAVSQSQSQPIPMPAASASCVYGSQLQQIPQKTPSSAQPNMVSPQYDDGIGELEFAGEFVSDQDYMQMPSQSADGPPKQLSAAASPADTSMSEYERRMRSNSLFSALLNEPRANHASAYGGGDASQEGEFDWMDKYTGPIGSSQGIQISRLNNSRRPSDPGLQQSGIGASLEASQGKQEKIGRKERQTKKDKKDSKKKQAEETVEEHVPGSGRPRTLSDPNLSTTYDNFGLMQVERPQGWVGAYSPDSRKVRIDRFLEKRNHRVWSKTIKYDVRKNFADSRLRVKGRFVRKEDELLMRELMSLT